MDLGRAGVAQVQAAGGDHQAELNNAGEEDAIRKAYIEIGKLYYAERGMAAEPPMWPCASGSPPPRSTLRRTRTALPSSSRRATSATMRPPAMWRPTCLPRSGGWRGRPTQRGDSPSGISRKKDRCAAAVFFLLQQPAQRPRFSSSFLGAELMTAVAADAGAGVDLALPFSIVMALPGQEF